MDEDRFCNGLQDYPQSVITAMVSHFCLAISSGSNGRFGIVFVNKKGASPRRGGTPFLVRVRQISRAAA